MNTTILGIETSCDETAVAIIHNEDILAEAVYTQKIHSRYGGVIPEFASRDHIRKLYPMVKDIFSSALVKPDDLDGVAVSSYPGLPGALLVGYSFAKGLTFAADVPLVKVNHLEGHLFAAKFSGAEPPFIALLVSGGHTEIIFVREWGVYEILGTTRDDAAGEAFDKIAQILGLPYPGGPQIQKLAEGGNPDAIKFPRAMMKSNDYDFSFSGLKTAAINLLYDWGAEKVRNNIGDICASFQEAVVDSLLNKLSRAVKEFEVDEIVIVGGVAANERLRQKAYEIFKDVKIPPKKYCTDNGAMIAFAGKFHLERGETEFTEFSFYRKS
ncbi:tRNA (adenosine(37)-N6)-threonylcarbamoyltransferase complex transferase subunit TsaD [bacterium]|nr:tRNA (adenosine(37)-N6)-threonylcarbamoyltransferase complex transferase subunit TsaD [bacterium]